MSEEFTAVAHPKEDLRSLIIRTNRQFSKVEQIIEKDNVYGIQYTSLFAETEPPWQICEDIIRNKSKRMIETTESDFVNSIVFTGSLQKTGNGELDRHC